MAAGLGYKEFTTGDVLTAADANGYLASQVVMVFASAAARTSAIASPQEGMIAYLKDTNAVEKYDGAAWVSVGGGGGGKVLQVVYASTSTSASVTSTTFTDSNLTATITPSAATSKILVMTSQPIMTHRNFEKAGFRARLMRGGTDIFTQATTPGSGGSGAIQVSGVVTNTGYVYVLSVNNMLYLDSPSTTSATTYKTQICVEDTANTGTVVAQANVSVSTIVLMEIGA